MDLENKAKDYVIELFAGKEHDLLLFHSLSHTEQTVEWAKEISTKENISTQQQQVIILAAWFLHTGYLYDFKRHRKHSLQMATDFLKQEKSTDEFILQVTCTIDSVLKNRRHAKIEAKILSDASTFFLASNDFLLRAKHNRQERNYFVKPKINKRSFWQNTQNYMKEQRFCSTTGYRLFIDGKKKNEARISALLAEELKAELPKDNRKIIEEIRQEVDKLGRKVDKKIVSTKDYDSLYRITARNQIVISGLADNKANILITINTLIISAVISFVLLQIYNFEYLIIPVILTIMFSLASTVFSVLATRPQIRPGVFSMDDFMKKKVNLLFYGNFYKMDYVDYENAMREMLKDPEMLFSVLTNDQFTLGKMLGEKFKLINIAITIFLIGITVSSISFLTAIILSNS